MPVIGYLRVLPALTACCIAFAEGALAQTVEPRFWGTDGSVNAVTVSGHVVYVGGLFNSVAPVTGGGVPVSAASGRPRGVFPKVAGAVYGVVSDGAGGWFITGNFTHVGGLARDNLAHVLADGSVADWNPRLDNAYGEPSTVYGWAVALAGQTVYVGGFFLKAGGVERVDLAAFDAVTGALSPWDPEPSGFITSLTVADSTLYVGGRFYQIAGQHRGYIAAFDVGSGALRGWSPEANSGVNAIAVRGKVVYAGGQFTFIGRATRRYLAALDAGTGAALGWNPSPNGEIKALAAGPSAIFAGGYFDSIGGQSRHVLAALNPTSGQVTDWTTPVPFLGVVGLALHEDVLFATGGELAAALDVRSGGARWTTALKGSGSAVAVHEGFQDGGCRGMHGRRRRRPIDEIYLAGDFNSMGERIPRTNLAAFDLRTGEVCGWNPGSDAPVDVLEATGDRVWIGGSFTKIHGEAHRGLAAVDRVRGIPDRDAPATDGAVLALEARGGRLYVGGRFTHFGDVERSNIACWDARRGRVAAWDPGADDIVIGLALAGDALYAGGSFTLAGGGGHGSVPRGHGAAFDAAGGRLLEWDPRADASVFVVLPADTSVYLGGPFEALGAEHRYAVAAVDPMTGAPRPWNPLVSAYNNGQHVRALATAGGYVYIAGKFNFLVDDFRYGLGAVDAISGALSSWNPAVFGATLTLERDDDVLFVGGGFRTLGGYPCDNFAVLRLGRTRDRGTDAPPRAALAVRVEASSPFALTCAPNPARSSAVLRLALPVATRATITLFDLAGRRVRKVLDSALAAGVHEVPLDTRGLAPGLYLCRLETPARSGVTRLVVTE